MSSLVAISRPKCSWIFSSCRNVIFRKLAYRFTWHHTYGFVILEYYVTEGHWPRETFLECLYWWTCVRRIACNTTMHHARFATYRVSSRKSSSKARRSHVLKCS
jgi:hypothetical protein